MIEITPTLKIDENEIRLDYMPRSRFGGQKVNKVATAVQLLFDIRGSPLLVDDDKQRLTRLAGKRAVLWGCSLSTLSAIRHGNGTGSMPSCV